MTKKIDLRSFSKSIALGDCIVDHALLELEIGISFPNFKLDTIRNTPSRLFKINQPIVDKRRLKRMETKQRKVSETL